MATISIFRDVAKVQKCLENFRILDFDANRIYELLEANENHPTRVDFVAESIRRRIAGDYSLEEFNLVSPDVVEVPINSDDYSTRNSPASLQVMDLSMNVPVINLDLAEETDPDDEDEVGKLYVRRKAYKRSLSPREQERPSTATGTETVYNDCNNNDEDPNNNAMPDLEIISMQRPITPVEMTIYSEALMIRDIFPHHSLGLIKEHLFNHIKASNRVQIVTNQLLADTMDTTESAPMDSGGELSPVLPKKARPATQTDTDEPIMFFSPTSNKVPFTNFFGSANFAKHVMKTTTKGAPTCTIVRPQQQTTSYENRLEAPSTSALQPHEQLMGTMEADTEPSLIPSTGAIKKERNSVEEVPAAPKQVVPPPKTNTEPSLIPSTGAIKKKRTSVKEVPVAPKQVVPAAPKQVVPPPKTNTEPSLIPSTGSIKKKRNYVEEVPVAPKQVVPAAPKEVVPPPKTDTEPSLIPSTGSIKKKRNYVEEVPVAPKQVVPAAPKEVVPPPKTDTEPSLIPSTGVIKTNKPAEEVPAPPKQVVPPHKFLSQLRELFPHVKVSFLERQCAKLPDDHSVEFLIDKILNKPHLPVKDAVLVNPEMMDVLPKDNEEDKEAAFQAFMEILPDADPEYLESKYKSFCKNPDELKRFVAFALEKRDYPKLEAYEKRQAQFALEKHFKDNFDMLKFLELFPDPFTFFRDPLLRVQRGSSPAGRAFLMARYRQVRCVTIDKVHRKNDYMLYPTCKELDLMPPGMRPRHNHEIISVYKSETSLAFLQEIGFIENEDKILNHLQGIKDAEKKAIADKAQAFADAKKSGELLTCGCCYDDEVLNIDMVACDDGHLFCKECAKKGAEVQIGQGKTNFPCLEDCGANIRLETLEGVLLPAVFSRLVQRKQMEEVKAAGIESFETCPFCDFGMVPHPDDRVFACQNPECLKESCRMCKEPSHIPLRCNEVEKSEEVKARTYIEDKMTAALIRTCWKCQKKFVKSDGCNKMTCSCGALMCYVCRQPVQDYTHFNGQGGDAFHKCPLYSNNNQLHVDAVEEEGRKAKEELESKNPTLSLKHDPTMILPEKVPQSLANAGHQGLHRALYAQLLPAFDVPLRVPVNQQQPAARAPENERQLVFNVEAEQEIRGAQALIDLRVRWQRPGPVPAALGAPAEAARPAAPEDPVWFAMRLVERQAPGVPGAAADVGEAAGVRQRPAVRVRPGPAVGVPPLPPGVRQRPAIGVPPGPAAGVRQQPAIGVPPGPAAGVRQRPAIGVPPGPAAGVRQRPAIGGPPGPAAGVRQRPAIGVPPGPAAGMQQRPAARVRPGPAAGRPGVGGERSGGAARLLPRPQAPIPARANNPVGALDEGAEHLALMRNRTRRLIEELRRAEAMQLELDILSNRNP